MPLILVKEGESRLVETSEDYLALRGEGWELGEGEKFNLYSRSGEPSAIPRANVDFFLRSQGYSPEPAEVALARAERARLKEEYGGTLSGIRAGFERFAGGLTLGTSDKLLAILGDEEGLRARAELHPGFGFVGTAASFLVPGPKVIRGASPGKQILANTPLNLLRRAAEKVAPKTPGALRTATVEGITGAGIGLQQAVSHSALSGEPISAEMLLTHIPTGALFGAAGGAVIGKIASRGRALELPHQVGSALNRELELAFQAGERSATFAKKLESSGKLLPSAVPVKVPEFPALDLITRATRRVPAGAEVPIHALWKDLRTTPGLGSLKLTQFKKELIEAAEKGLVRLSGRPASLTSKAALPSATRVGDETFYTLVGEDVVPAIEKIPVAEFQATRPLAGPALEELTRTQKQLREFAGTPPRVDTREFVRLRPEEAQAYVGAVDEYMAALQRVDTEVFPNGARVLLDPVKYKASVLAMLPERTRKSAALLMDLPESLLEARTAPGKLLGNIYTAARASQIKLGPGRLLTTAVMSGADVPLGLAGLAGVTVGERAWRAAQGLRFLGYGLNKLTRIVDGTFNQVSKAVEKVVVSLSKREKPIARTWTVASTLGGSQFWNTRHPDNRTAELRRIHEVWEATANLPATRSYINQVLSTVQVQSPYLALQLEDGFLRRLAFLRSKLPAGGTLDATGNIKVPPLSPDARLALTRYIRAVENPMVLLEDLGNRDVAVETVEAVEAVYPELFQEIQRQVALAITGKSMRYADRLLLGILYKIPADETLEPGFMQRLKTLAFPTKQETLGTPAPARRQPKVPEATRGQRQASP